MEKVVRKLLVVSQKGGVGKTTTSVNLAAASALSGARVLLLEADPLSNISVALKLNEHSQRRVLRETGIDLPGVLVSNVVPGLDVLSPHSGTGCFDEELEGILHILKSSAIQKAYDCLIVDTPPFLGVNPGQLLGICQEYVLVLRAERLAYRTMPAFLELIRRSQAEGNNQLKGIVLTLPEGEDPGGQWERELRGRFGTRILPAVIPFDEEVEKALVFGQTVVASNPKAPSSQGYVNLTEMLRLAEDAKGKPATSESESPLLRVAGSIEVPVVARAPQGSAPVIPSKARTERTSKGSKPTVSGSAPTADKSSKRPEVRKPAPKPTPPRDDSKELARPGTRPQPQSPEVPTGRSTPTSPVRPSRLRKRLSAPSVPRVPATEPSRIPATPAPTFGIPKPRNGETSSGRNAPPTPSGNSALPLWLMWVGLGALFGFAVRFIHLPKAAVPIIVGVAATAGVLLALRVVQKDKEDEPKAGPGPQGPQQAPSNAHRQAVPTAHDRIVPRRPQPATEGSPPNSRLARVVRRATVTRDTN